MCRSNILAIQSLSATIRAMEAPHQTLSPSRYRIPADAM
jgi:hypothetical protein